MRMPRFLTRRPRPAAILAAGLATAFLGSAAVLSPATADQHAGTPLPTPTVATAPAPTATPAVTDKAIADAYNEGWTEGQDDFMATDCTGPIPTLPDSDDPLVTAYNEGWIDGQHDLADTGACKTDPATDATVTAAYNAGWEAGVRDLGDGTAPTIPNVTGDGSNPGTVAWMDGWKDGQADALADDGRDVNASQR
ncbi:hypothetical protein ABZ023_18540 [Streptomyces sp. NPDC006367]|uniref:hypothetical protein n=1 Tax=unclassified Streptomyces TaxID=2593676 RepID=UPI0033A6307F